MSDVLEQLRKAVGESHVRVGEAVHEDYTHDETLTVSPVVPLALVLPGSTDEVVEVLRVATEHRVPVIARGSGTGLSGAAVPVPDGILLAFDRMDRIREIDTENQVAVVEPGVTLEQLNAALAPPRPRSTRCHRASRPAPSAATPGPTPAGCGPCATA